MLCLASEKGTSRFGIYCRRGRDHLRTGSRSAITGSDLGVDLEIAAFVYIRA